VSVGRSSERTNRAGLARKGVVAVTNPHRRTNRRSERAGPKSPPTAAVSRKTGSVKIPAQGPLCETFDEVLYALGLTVRYVASRRLDG
jgi:hypothetical protein